jgi:hypothetical protein
MYLLGRPIAFLECDDGTIVMGGDWGYSPSDDETGSSFAYRSLDGDGSIVVRVASVVENEAGAQAGVMIRGSLEGKVQSAAVTVTAGQGVTFWHRRIEGGSTERLTRSGLRAPHWIKLTRTGDVLTAWHSADGVEWMAFADDPAASSVELALDEKVCIGLVVGSQASAVSARFSDISLTGNMTDSWAVARIGSKHPYEGNDPDSVYVALADENGNLAALDHPDPLAVGASTWQRGDIPLGEFVAAGVDVTRITQMFVGVGDRDNPTPAGEGMLHFDDFHLTRADTAAELNAVP